MANDAGVDLLPVTAVTYATLKRGRDHGIPVNSCVAICRIFNNALAHYGISSHLEAVTVEIQVDSRRVKYGPAKGAWYAEQTYLGHSVVVIPDLYTLVDPTNHQFSEVRKADTSGTPVIARVPGLMTDLGAVPISIDMDHYEITYAPNPVNRDAWRPDLDDVAAKILEDSVDLHGEDVALEALELLRYAPTLAMVGSLYPRIRRLVDALGDTEFVEDEVHGPCFKDKTGAKLRLRDLTR